jgi:hypothetical protein
MNTTAHWLVSNLPSPHEWLVIFVGIIATVIVGRVSSFLWQLSKVQPKKFNTWILRARLASAKNSLLRFYRLRNETGICGTDGITPMKIRGRRTNPTRPRTRTHSTKPQTKTFPVLCRLAARSVPEKPRREGDSNSGVSRLFLSYVRVWAPLGKP